MFRRPSSFLSIRFPTTGSASSSSSTTFLTSFLSSNSRFCSSSSNEQNKKEEEEEEEELLDVESVSTASAISRTLRNYREANPETAKQWADLETLMNSKYLSRINLDQQQTQTQSTSSSSSSSSFETTTTTATQNSCSSQQQQQRAPALRPLQTAEEIISGSQAFRAAGLELKPQLLVRLKAQRRAANVFVDADGLSPESVQEMISSNLRLIPEFSSIVVAKQPTAPANFGKQLSNYLSYASSSSSSSFSVDSSSSSSFSLPDQNARQFWFSWSGSIKKNPNFIQEDVIVPHNTVKTYMMIEKLATRLLLAHTVVLNDIVYVCRDESFKMYVERVSQATPFLDADVFVCSPERFVQVYSKQVMPSLSQTLVSPST